MNSTDAMQLINRLTAATRAHARIDENFMIGKYSAVEAIERDQTMRKAIEETKKISRQILAAITSERPEPLITIYKIELKYTLGSGSYITRISVYTTGNSEADEEEALELVQERWAESRPETDLISTEIVDVKTGDIFIRGIG